MKKFLHLLLLLTAVSFTACGSEGSSTTEGYVDPGITAKTIQNKSYSLTLGSCTSSTQCGAIIYQGELDGTNYVGIAVDNQHSVNPPTFKLKIWWPASSIPSSVNLAPGSFNVSLITGGSAYTSATTNLQLTLTGPTNNVYTITFTGALTVGSQTIPSSSTIEAYKYPE